MCAIGIPLFFSWILANVLANVGAQAFRPVGAGQPPVVASLAGLISPFTLLGGVLRWLQGNPAIGPAYHPLQATTIGGYGPVYGALFVVLTVAGASQGCSPATGELVWRDRDRPAQCLAAGTATW